MAKKSAANSEKHRKGALPVKRKLSQIKISRELGECFIPIAIGTAVANANLERVKNRELGEWLKPAVC